MERIATSSGVVAAARTVAERAQPRSSARSPKQAPRCRVWTEAAVPDHLGRACLDDVGPVADRSLLEDGLAGGDRGVFERRGELLDRRL